MMRRDIGITWRGHCIRDPPTERRQEVIITCANVSSSVRLLSPVLFLAPLRYKQVPAASVEYENTRENSSSSCNSKNKLRSLTCTPPLTTLHPSMPLYLGDTDPIQPPPDAKHPYKHTVQSVRLFCTTQSGYAYNLTMKIQKRNEKSLHRSRLPAISKNQLLDHIE